MMPILSSNRMSVICGSLFHILIKKNQKPIDASPIRSPKLVSFSCEPAVLIRTAGPK